MDIILKLPLDSQIEILSLLSPGELLKLCPDNEQNELVWRRLYQHTFGSLPKLEGTWYYNYKNMYTAITTNLNKIIDKQNKIPKKYLCKIKNDIIEDNFRTITKIIDEVYTNVKHKSYSKLEDFYNESSELIKFEPQLLTQILGNTEYDEIQDYNVSDKLCSLVQKILEKFISIVPQ